MIRLSTYIAHSASQGYALRFPSIGEGNYRPAYYANGTNFVHGGKGFLQNYNADQKTAIRALPQTADGNDYYLFFVDCYDRLDTAGMVSNEIVSGYMPVGRHYGFIYNEFNNPRTIAHELGHGVNALHHTFSSESESYHAPQGTTPNLMDYSGGTALNHLQWQWSHETHRNILGFLDDEGEGEGIKKNNPLITFKIKGKKTAENVYADGDLFATLHTNDLIDIQLDSKDTTINVKKLCWYLNNKKLSPVDTLNDKVQITLDSLTIPLKEIDLTLQDSISKKQVAKLKFEGYLPPYVEFYTQNSYNGEFLFDDSFRRLKNIEDKSSYYAQYQTIKNSKNKNITIPVMGVPVENSANIEFKIYDDDLAKKDKNFYFVIKGEQSGISINGKDSLIIKYPISSNNITISAQDPVTTNIISTINTIKKDIGKIEFYSRNIEKRYSKLIFIKFKGEKTYPQLDTLKLVKYLNNNCFNQLFREISIRTEFISLNVPIPSAKDNQDLLISIAKLLSNNKLLLIQQKVDSLTKIEMEQYKKFLNDSLNSIKIKKELSHIDSTLIKKYKILLTDSSLSLYEDSIKIIKKAEASKITIDTLSIIEDEYYITDISITNSAGQAVGGFHNVGEKGGVQTKYTPSPCETREILTAHEMGHWLGLPHPFKILSSTGETQELDKERKCFFVTPQEKQTDSNFMDYFICRKTWFKFQMLNIK